MGSSTSVQGKEAPVSTRVIGLVGLCWLLLALSSGASHVSLLAIALECAQYDEEEVTVIGAARWDHEEREVCPTREFLSADPLNCLWLELPTSAPTEEKEQLTDHLAIGEYVLIDGTVSCEKRGHGELYAGSLTEITLIALND